MGATEETPAPRERKNSISAPGLASDEDAAVLGELLPSSCFIGMRLPSYREWGG